MEDFDPHHILCYDSEFVREHSYIPKLALVQTCQPGGSAHLYDPLDGTDAVPWHNILHHPAPVVLHAGAQDLELMQLCGGALPQTVRDTQIGFALCSPHLAVSYAQLVEHFPAATGSRARLMPNSAPMLPPMSNCSPAFIPTWLLNCAA